MVDIDFFKRYNDSKGHLDGDSCLKLVARALRHAIRRPADFVARYGGEEFTLLLPNTELDGAEEVARMIMKNLADLALEHPDSPVGPHVTVSIGIATTFPDLNRNCELLVDAADKALYRAKHSGRNRIETHQF